MNAGFYNPQHMNKRTLAQYTVKMFLTKASMATVLITIATRWYHPVSLPDCTWVPPEKVGVVNCLLSLKYARTAAHCSRHIPVCKQSASNADID